MSKIKIDKSVEVTKSLPFKPMPEFGGLCLGFLSRVSVVEVESKEDAKWEFAGQTIPRLQFEFVQFKADPNDKDRIYTQGIMPVTLTLSNGDERESAKVVTSYQNVWNQIKHLHDQYKGTENYKELAVEPEFDTDLSVEERLNEFRKFFTAVAKEFNGTKGKSLFASTGGKDKLLTMKLIVDGNQLKFPDFVGRGYVETAKFKDGKLDTTLFFTQSETYTFEAGGKAAAPSGAGSPVDSDLPADVQAMINKNK